MFEMPVPSFNMFYIYIYVIYIYIYISLSLYPNILLYCLMCIHILYEVDVYYNYQSCISILVA